MDEKLNATQKRERCLFDPLYLSEMLGYDFHITPHGEELLNTVAPPLKSSGKVNEALPLFDLSPRKRRLILWSRGHYKTSAVVVRIVNLILAYPDIRILVGQSTAKNARGLLREIKSHFDGTNPKSKLRSIFPAFCKTTRLGIADGFVTPARKRTHLKEFTVGVAGDRTARAGQHYDVMVFDDLVTEQNYRSTEQQEKLIETFSHFVPLLEPGGYITVTGTRYSFGDLYGDIIQKDSDVRDWDVSKKTCWKNDLKENGPLFPATKADDGRSIGFTKELLEKIEKNDPETFSYQYLNEPILAGRALFTEELLMRCLKLRPSEQDPDCPTFGPTVLFVDLAASKRAASDHSVVVAGKQDSLGRMWAVDMRADRWSPLQVAHAVLEMTLQHRPARVLIEGTAAGKYFIEYAKVIAQDKGIILPIDEIHVSTQKDAKYLRIASIEGALKTGKLFFLVGLPGWIDMVEQFKQFPKGRHDDEIDTVSLMVQFFTGQKILSGPISTGLPWFLRAPSSEQNLSTQILNPALPVRETVGDFF